MSLHKFVDRKQLVCPRGGVTLCVCLGKVSRRVHKGGQGEGGREAGRVGWRMVEGRDSKRQGDSERKM